MEIMALHEAALDRAAELVAGLALDQVDQPTSCTDRDVDVSAASRWQPAVGREAWGRPPRGAPRPATSSAATRLLPTARRARR